MNKTIELLNMKWSDLYNIPLDDKDVIDNIYAKGNTNGIFQMESQVPRDIFKTMYNGISKEEYSIEDVVAVNALNRPAVLGVGMHNTYIKGKREPDSVSYIHPDLEPIFNKTHSIMLYQEQALSVFRLAGFPDEEVDVARRNIGKKETEEIKEWHEKLSNGLKSRGWNESQIEEIWNLIAKQAEYSFNRSHSVSYAILSFIMAYFKHYHPKEFIASLLSDKQGNYEDTSLYLDEARRMNIKVSEPKINKFNESYTIVDDGILFGLSSIKDISKDVVANIISEREIRPFKNMKDLLKRVNVDRTSAIALIKSGALGMNKDELIEEYANLVYTPTKLKLPEKCPAKATLIKNGVVSKDDYAVSDRDLYFEKYKQMKRKNWENKEEKREKKHIDEFKEKYMGDPSMYEFESLSTFINGNPFDKYRNLIKPFEEHKDGENKILVAGTIIDIQRKKQKNGGRFAYISLLTIDGVYEGIIFNDSYQEYNDLIVKGNNIVTLSKKSKDQFIIGKIRTFEDWKLAVAHKVE